MTDAATTAAIRAHVEAVTVLLLGQERMKQGLVICGGGPLDMAGIAELATMAQASQTDVVFLSFEETGNGAVRMTDISLIVPRDHQCFVQRGCKFWLSRNTKRGLILPRAESRGHFVAEAGEMVHIDGKPSANPAAGLKRAEGWIRRWVKAGTPTPANAHFFEIAQAS